ncbi:MULTISPECIES: imm11 family protein [unclassified Ruegeria]|uniref:imm11 family protein n=1 Tax=unclassified Ruegeria TaxID=2625375 RepID=UPI001487BC66|nr:MULTISPECIES: DUF1629 domain-containing protein [unclassified Ruegeria]
MENDLPERESHVWISTTWNNKSGVTPMTRREYERHWRAGQPKEIGEKYSELLQRTYDKVPKGEVLTAEEIGDVWYYGSQDGNPAPSFMNGGGLPVLSDSAKVVLEQFDLGETYFHAIRLQAPAGHATRDEPYYILNVCNKRLMGNYEALGPEGDLTAPLNNKYGKRFLPRKGSEHKLVVSPEALGGPDIWIDPKVPRLLFLSERLVSALKAAGVDDGWGLVRCPVGVL